jgi:hypothetical protein
MKREIKKKHTINLQYQNKIEIQLSTHLAKSQKDIPLFENHRNSIFRHVSERERRIRT